MTERTDRELLMLAAKAAGITPDKLSTNGGGAGNTGFDILGNLVLDWHDGITWNPLEDDGDALRLGAYLGIFMRTDFICRLSALMKTGMDHTAATRRAIVQVSVLIAEKGIAAAAMAEGGEQ